MPIYRSKYVLEFDFQYLEEGGGKKKEDEDEEEKNSLYHVYFGVFQRQKWTMNRFLSSEGT